MAITSSAYPVKSFRRRARPGDSGCARSPQNNGSSAEVEAFNTLCLSLLLPLADAALCGGFPVLKIP